MIGEGPVPRRRKVDALFGAPTPDEARGEDAMLTIATPRGVKETRSKARSGPPRLDPSSTARATHSDDAPRSGAGGPSERPRARLGSKA